MATKAPFLRTAYNYDMDAASKETGLTCPEKTLTQQSFKEETDINTIVDRFHLTGQIPQLDKLPAYGDYEGIFDFQSAMNTIREAEETFMQLPADIRARFNNQPQQFLEFCNDKENLPEARKMGFLSEEAMARLDKAAEEAEDARSAARAATRGAKAEPASDHPGASGGPSKGGESKK